MSFMSLDTFFDRLEDELQFNLKLKEYHRIINDKSNYLFRKLYYYQRLEFMLSQIDLTKVNRILDLGCGYGTSSYLLAHFNQRIVATTLEYYYDEIENRNTYWNKYVNTDCIEFKYENFLKADYLPKQFDYVIVQDTLHHLEPINEALEKIHMVLKDEGIVIVNEENGSNIICRIKHFKERGFKRIIKIYDEKLNEWLLFGNENTRNISKWESLFRDANMKVIPKSKEYIRVLPSMFYMNKDMNEVAGMENKIGSVSKYFNKYFFFGINFCAMKNQALNQ